jgi:UDPglucose 6-dehydrogenase
VQAAARRVIPCAEIPRDELDFVLLAVGTPTNETGSTEIAFVAHALDQAIPATASGAAGVFRSTLPVGAAVRLANRPGVGQERLFVLPEFLRQGTALQDIRQPSRVVVGTFGEHRHECI